MDGEQTFSLAATGDLMISHAPADPAGAKALFRGADLVVTNLENPLTDRGWRADKLVNLRGSPAMAHELARLGIHVATLANNHALDYGVEGLQDTIGALQAADVRPCGTGEDDVAAFAPALVQVNGLWVAVLSFACTVPTGGAAGPDRAGMAAIRVQTDVVFDGTIFEEQPGTSPYVRTRCVEVEVERAVAAVREARQQADFVVVGLHWGVPPGWAAPFQGTYAEYQRPLGHRLVEAGAGLIVGNHAHAPLGIEVYRDVPIVYSIGNFMFHLFADNALMPVMRPAPPYDLTAFAGPEMHQAFVLHARAGRAGVRSLEIHPIILNAAAEPEPAPDAVARHILATVQRLSPDPERIRIEGTVGHLRLEPVAG